MTACPFCAILNDGAPATIVRRWPDAIAIKPLGPVTDGHTLVIPHAHVPDATSSPRITGLTMQCAADLARRYPASNLITSCGPAATQTVRHLHIHIVPRHHGDRLRLPWSP